MKTPSLSMKLTLILSLSITATSTSLFFTRPYLKTPTTTSSLSQSPSIPKATPSDIISLLGPTPESLKINPLVSKEINDCFKFLVPFRPVEGIKRRSEEEENELIWWPPEAVLDLARLAVDSGGDVDAIHRTLDPSIIPVPDVEGLKEHGCQLTRTPYGRSFINGELNSYMEFLFQLIAARGLLVGLDVSLNRYDFFHGHLFLSSGSGRLGILFHAKEYPAYDKEVFPYNMGFCQSGSNVEYDDSMNLRNILWLAPLPSNSTEEWVAPGVLVILDAHPGGIIYRDIIPEYVHIARTIYEHDFGDVAIDVNYLNVGDKRPDYQIFIC